jgi:c-di-GMP-binding flagellar brake protein YcgR
MTNQTKTASVEGQRLDLEFGSKMTLNFAGQKEPMKIRFVGMEPGGYLIVRIPEAPELNDNLQKGKYVNLRYVSWGKVYGFRSVVRGAFSEKDFFLLILSYPKTVRSHELRKETRMDTFSPAILTVNQVSYSGSITDFSPGGCGFAMNSPAEHLNAELGQKVTLSFKAPGQPGPQILPCFVRNIREEGPLVAFSLQFNLTSEVTFSFKMFRQFLKKGR